MLSEDLVKRKMKNAQWKVHAKTRVPELKKSKRRDNLQVELNPTIR